MPAVSHSEMEFLFPRAEAQAEGARDFASPGILQNGPRRQGATLSRKTSAALTAPGRSGN